MNAPSHLWAVQAARWRHIGPPLRPGAEDLAYLTEHVVRRLPRTAAPLRILMLGVTPELACLRRDAPCELVAVDSSAAMIAGVWPGDAPGRHAVCGDWFRLPVRPGVFDCALGDGCFSALDYPQGYRRLATALAEALRPSGSFAIRCFCRPPHAETPAAVFAALERGGIGSFHAFKWRLAMALHGEDIARGVTLAHVWTTFQERVPDRAAWARQRGWSLPVIDTIDNYRDLTARYTYPTVAEIAGALGDAFRLVREWRGGYELAERCPHLLFRRR
jgi:SAM-dependent methyltransferase